MDDQPWPHKIAAQLCAGEKPHCPEYLRKQVSEHLKSAVHVKAAAICAEPLLGQREAMIKAAPDVIREHVQKRVDRLGTRY